MDLDGLIEHAVRNTWYAKGTPIGDDWHRRGAARFELPPYGGTAAVVKSAPRLNGLAPMHADGDGGCHVTHGEEMRGRGGGGASGSTAPTYGGTAGGSCAGQHAGGGGAYPTGHVVGDRITLGNGETGVIESLRPLTVRLDAKVGNDMKVRVGKCVDCDHTGSVGFDIVIGTHGLPVCLNDESCAERQFDRVAPAKAPNYSNTLPAQFTADAVGQAIATLRQSAARGMKPAPHIVPPAMLERPSWIDTAVKITPGSGEGFATDVALPEMCCGGTAVRAECPYHKP